MSQADTDMLQRAQNVIKRGLLQLAEAPWTTSSTNIRRDLHRLPVNHRITYKPRLITWKTLHTIQSAIPYTSLN